MALAAAAFPMLTDLKKCRLCATEKERSLFHKAKGNRDGLATMCKECAYEVNRRWVAANGDRRKQIANAYAQRKQDERKQYNARYYQQKQASINERNAEYRRRNPHVARKTVQKWQSKNPDKLAANVAKRRSSKLLATPSWANHFFISEAYHLAKLRERICGGKWHVDHIVPLQSPLVCGLHVENNLRVIPAVENMRKSNRYWPDGP